MEFTLRAVITELRGTVPGRALYVVDGRYDDDWLTAIGRSWPRCSVCQGAVA